MKKQALSVLVAVFVFTSAGLASATTISITGSSSDLRYVAGTNDNSNLGTVAAICAAFFGANPCPLTGSGLLYKTNADSGEEATSYKNSYQTTFAASNEAATISYSGGSNPAIACPNCWLIVKDGSKGNPAQFLFRLNAVGALAAWNGTSNIDLSGFWVGTQGAISNVAIWGLATTVPDGGSAAALLGSALLGLGLLRRRFGRG